MKNTLRVTFVTLLSSLLMACGGGGNSGCSAVLGLLPGAGCSTPNTAPVANAGVTQNVTAGTLVTLDGSGSRDANNQSLTYLWQMTAVPAGSLAKAALVGAKIVNGPGPLNVSASPAANTAATSVVWSGEPTAISTTVLADVEEVSMIII